MLFEHFCCSGGIFEYDKIEDILKQLGWKSVFGFKMTRFHNPDTVKTGQ